MTVISGKSYWAQVVAPSTKFDEGGVYSIDVSVDAENKKKAEADGLSVKNKGDERGDFVTIKRKATRKDGTQNRAPEIKDHMKRPLEGVLIGNGSTVNVLYRMYDWKWGGNSLRFLILVTALSRGRFNAKAEAEPAISRTGLSIVSPASFILSLLYL